MLLLGAQVRDHYLRIEGELSSSSCGFHPGERQTVVIEKRKGHVSQVTSGRVVL